MQKRKKNGLIELKELWDTAYTSVLRLIFEVKHEYNKSGMQDRANLWINKEREQKKSAHP